MPVSMKFIPEKGIYELEQVYDWEGPKITNTLHESMANMLFHAFSTKKHGVIMAVPTDYGRSVGMLVIDKDRRAIVKLELEWVRGDFYV